MPSTFPSISAEAAIRPSAIPGAVTGSLTALGCWARSMPALRPSVLTCLRPSKDSWSFD